MIPGDLENEVRNPQSLIINFALKVLNYEFGKPSFTGILPARSKFKDNDPGLMSLEMRSRKVNQVIAITQ